LEKIEPLQSNAPPTLKTFPDLMPLSGDNTLSGSHWRKNPEQFL